jgi:hypothetical protein
MMKTFWLLFSIIFWSCNTLWADTVTLKSGKIYQGKVIHQTPVFVRIELQDPPRFKEFLAEEVKDIQMDSLGEMPHSEPQREESGIIKTSLDSDSRENKDTAPLEENKKTIPASKSFQEVAPLEFEFRRHPVVEGTTGSVPAQTTPVKTLTSDEEILSVSRTSSQRRESMTNIARRVSVPFRKYHWAGIAFSVLFWIIFKFRGTRSSLFLGFLWMIYGIYRTVDHMGMQPVTVLTRWDIYVAPLLCLFSILEALFLLIPRKIKKDPYLPPPPLPPKPTSSVGKKPLPTDSNFHDPGAHRGRI